MNDNKNILISPTEVPTLPVGEVESSVNNELIYENEDGYENENENNKNNEKLQKEEELEGNSLESPMSLKNGVENLTLLDPEFVTGFTDAEGCFHISIVEKVGLKIGKSVRVMFQITLHGKDVALLHQIKKYFSVGSVIKRNDGMCYYKVFRLKDLMLIIKHFDKYPLLTHKNADYELFKQVVSLISKGEHLTLSGLQKIVNIKASMNFKTLSDKLSAAFPNTAPVNRPTVIPKVPNSGWVSGFVDGEACFYINIYKRKDSVLGEGVKLIFKVTQDIRNKYILESLIKVFGCGGVYNQSKSSSGSVFDFMVTGLSNITDKVIPFFLAHPLQGAKRKEFEDFVKVAELMQVKAHLTKDGLEEIRAIKLGMNRQRTS